jgi:hypothetical protein
MNNFNKYTNNKYMNYTIDNINIIEKVKICDIHVNWHSQSGIWNNLTIYDNNKKKLFENSKVNGKLLEQIALAQEKKINISDFAINLINFVQKNKHNLYHKKGNKQILFDGQYELTFVDDVNWHSHLVCKIENKLALIGVHGWEHHPDDTQSNSSSYYIFEDGLADAVQYSKIIFSEKK